MEILQEKIAYQNSLSPRAHIRIDNTIPFTMAEGQMHLIAGNSSYASMHYSQTRIGEIEFSTVSVNSGLPESARVSDAGEEVLGGTAPTGEFTVPYSGGTARIEQGAVLYGKDKAEVRRGDPYCTAGLLFIGYALNAPAGMNGVLMDQVNESRAILT